MATLKSDAISILHECCLCRAPALILDPDSDSIWHARLEAVTLESVTLCLFEEFNHSIEASSLFISFSHKGNCCAFLATVLECRNNESHLPFYMTLQLPSKIIGMERRMCYRVAIGEDVVPLVRVSTEEGQILLPKPKDISLTGMMIDFDPAEDPDLQPRAELWLELRLDDDEVLLKGIVKHRNDHRYSLVFPEVFATKHGIYAPQPLRKIVKSLEPVSLHGEDRPDEPAFAVGANGIN